MTCLQLLSESAQVGGAEGAVLHPQLKSLVEYIWAEATGELEEVGIHVARVGISKRFSFGLWLKAGLMIQSFTPPVQSFTPQVAL